ncbi:MAG: exodeoxyribonuclease III [Planctomycetaceae bacterium]|nr:exodeoxyribonuclease III [Planctomycetaceae bacterium]
MRIVSWNVNGIRACANKGFEKWLAGCDADIVGLQEVRANETQIPASLRAPEGWYTHWSPAERPGYSGVGLYSRLKPKDIGISLGKQEFDVEGRVQIAEFGRLIVANIYFPNGSGKERDNARVPYKLAFYHRLFELLEKERKRGRPILVMGDYNTAHKEIDLARPKANETTSGFLPEERAEIDRLLKLGWVDTFREFEKGPDHYSWWSQRGGSRKRNVGWRIDYVLASPAAMKHVRSAAIHPDVHGSDHCPVSVELDSKTL